MVNQVRKARLYGRASTQEQAKTGYSLSAQMKRLEAFCVSQGWTIVGRYCDEGVSAKDMNRPAFQKMLNECEANDVILVYKLDRLTRSVRDLDDMLRLFEKRNIYFYSITEHFDTTTATGRLMLRLIAEIAQWERETIAERSSLGIRERILKGKFHGSHAPFGYMRVPSGEFKRGRELLKVVPDPNTRHIVVEIYEKYLSGYGVRYIAKWLNQLGIKTQKGGKWYDKAVIRVLTNPFYCGEIDVRKFKRSKDDPDTVPGDHEPIISKEMFEAVQRVMDSRKKIAPRYATGYYPLSGIAHCGLCGGRICGRSYRDVRYYACDSYLTGKGCGERRSLTSTNAEKCERNLIEQIAKLQHPDDLNRFIEDYAKAEYLRLSDLNAEIDRLRSEIAETKRAINRWDEAYETGQLDLDKYLSRIRSLEERLKSQQERLAELETKQAIIPQHEVLKQASIDLVTAWDEIPLMERKALLKDFLDAFNLRVLLYHGGRVELVPGA